MVNNADVHKEALMEPVLWFILGFLNTSISATITLHQILSSDRSSGKHFNLNEDNGVCKNTHSANAMNI